MRVAGLTVASPVSLLETLTITSSDGAELLISDDPQKVYKIAISLDKYNSERKSIEMLLFRQIDLEIKKFHNHPVPKINLIKMS